MQQMMSGPKGKQGSKVVEGEPGKAAEEFIKFLEANKFLGSNNGN
jgi:hypothetical protein